MQEESRDCLPWLWSPVRWIGAENKQHRRTRTELSWRGDNTGRQELGGHLLGRM